MNNEFWAQKKEVTQIAKDTLQVSFMLQNSTFKFIPGQYVWVVLEKLSFPDPRGDRRAFSIVSPPENTNEFSIILRQGISGYKKTLLGLKNQDKTRIIGPFGSSFALNNTTRTNIVMIAGGVGIAPFLGILRSYPLLTNKPNITLVNFNSNPEKQFLSEEIESLCKKYNLSFINKIGHTVISSELNITQYKDATFFICGPQGMVDSVYVELRSHGIDERQLIFEEVYPCSTQSINL